MEQPKSLADLPDVLTVAEAAAVLRLCRASVYELLRQEVLPAFKVGRRLIIPKRALLALLGQEPEEAPQPEPGQLLRLQTVFLQSFLRALARDTSLIERLLERAKQE